MSESESILLQRFVSRADAGAFSEIVRRHAGLVYGTCLRVLADADQAADATQETFFQLMKKADQVTESIPGWLHRVAVRQAVDLIRSDSRRRRREQVYADNRANDDPTWRQICPHVDEALSQLDADARELLVGHYMEGCSMTDLADRLGVSRATVSRRIGAGLKRLRAQLHKRGVTVAAVTLGTLLAENTAQGAPAWLIRQLGKVSLVGAEVSAASCTIGAASSPSLLSGGVLAAVNTKLVVAVSAAIIVGAGLLTYTRSSRGPQVPEPIPVVTTDRERPPVRRNTRPEPARAERVEPEEVKREAASQAMTRQTSPSRVSTIVDPPVEPSVAPSRPDEPQASEFQLDLTSPEATVRSFTKAWVLGDAESVLACWFPTAGDFEDIARALDAGPDDPQIYEGKMWFQSLDPDAEMPIIWTEDIDGGTKLAWRVTLKKDAMMGGRMYQAGETEDIEVTVRPSGDSWLIDNM